MKISFVISSLGAGGAERALVGIANWYAALGHDITIITNFDHASFYEIRSDIRRVQVPATDAVTSPKNIKQRIQVFVQRILRMRQAIVAESPDRLVSFLDTTNILVLMACVGLPYKVIVCERSNPLYYPISRFQNFLRHRFYPYADGLVVQTDSLVPWARSHIAEHKIHVIPNTLDKQRADDIAQVQPVSSEVMWTHRIITLGRLTQEKGHDLLLQAFAQIAGRYPDWGLEIVGDGVLIATLEALAAQLGIRGRVKFYGQLKSPFGLLKSADIFVLPSRVEGFPNALLEAMALGVPVVSFNCPSGPADLIQHESNGLLVSPENTAEMARALERLMTDQTQRMMLGNNARSVLDTFAEARVMKAWDGALSL